MEYCIYGLESLALNNLISSIAIVSEEYPPNIHGGVGTFCCSLASLLSKRKVFTSVFTGGSHKLQVERINDYLEIVRFPFLNLPPHHVWFQLQNFSEICKRAADHSFSLVHSASPEVSPIGIYLKKKLDKPLVTSYHGYTSYEMKAFFEAPISQASLQDFGFNVLEYPIYDVYNRISIAYSNRIVTCSHAILNELRTVYRNLDLGKCSVIYNGVDLSEFDSMRQNKGLSRKTADYTIVFFGRWFWSKGIQYLLEAFKLVANEYSSVQLRICGKGPMEPKIRAFIARNGLAGSVRILGHVSRKQLLTELLDADVVVLPSLREAQPISVLEAMACRKPVVVFDFPFVHEYIQNSFNGLLAKGKDSKDLANTILTLLSDKNLRNKLGENAYRYVQLKHNWENIADNYLNLYEKLIAAN